MNDLIMRLTSATVDRGGCFAIFSPSPGDADTCWAVEWWVKELACLSYTRGQHNSMLSALQEAVDRVEAVAS